MQSLSNLNLPHLPITDAAFAAAPFAYFEAARDRHPWLATSNLGYIVTEYQAMHDLFIQDDRMRFCLDRQLEVIGVTDTVFGRNALRSVMGSQAERHRHLRDIYAPAFSPRHANELRPLIRAAIEQLFDDRAPRGDFDFHEFATWVPVAAMFAILGVCADRIAEIKPDLDTFSLSASLKREFVPAINAAALRLMSFVRDLIQSRIHSPPAPGQPDFLGTLIAARDQKKLDDQQLVVDLIAFITAGGGTVAGMLTFIMALLIDRPEIYKRCAEDLDFCGLVVEEGLRYTSTSTAVRLTTEEVFYRDVEIPRDTIMFFPFSISGRDPGAFPDGETFDPDRSAVWANRHIAFGLGRHFCLGQYIARVELQEGLHLIAQGIREPELAGEITWRPFPGIWGPETLPIRFTSG